MYNSYSQPSGYPNALVIKSICRTEIGLGGVAVKHGAKYTTVNSRYFTETAKCISPLL